MSSIHYGPSLTEPPLPDPADEPTVTVFLSVGLHDSTGALVSATIETAIRRTLENLPTIFPGVTILGRFNGEGIWEGSTEPCTAILFTAPLPTAIHLRDVALPFYAQAWQQSTIGFVCHDTDVHPTSYVAAL